MLRRDRPLTVGLMLPTWTDGSGLPTWTNGRGEAGIRWSTIAANARLAESVGFDSLWVPDHFVMDDAWETPPGGGRPAEIDPDAPPSFAWEAWSILAGLAAITTTVELGPLVACAGYRNPALLAKIADTVDEMSGGRVILGVGAGDHWSEHERYGFDWKQPVGRFEDALQIIRPLLRGGTVDFEGRHHRASGAVLQPRGPRLEGPPILIGALGTGPRMLRLTVEYADLWNGWFVFVDTDPGPDIELAVQRVVAACESSERDPATLGLTVSVSVALDGAVAQGGSVRGSPAEIADRLGSFAALGIEQVQVVLAPSGAQGIEAFAEVLEILDGAR
jgi:alkanesulfonate monooxygenase SsuD/methylene tetrahydromethanopterin reductase-like flavin-dependent oxidoreductase (luciferase family)